MYYWLKPQRAIIRGTELYFIELIGLNGVQTYAPLRVLLQFGQIQMIPLRSHMSHYGYDFGSELPQVNTILRRWQNKSQKNQVHLPTGDRVDVNLIGESAIFEDEVVKNVLHVPDLNSICCQCRK